MIERTPTLNFWMREAKALAKKYESETDQREKRYLARKLKEAIDRLIQEIDDQAVKK